METNYCDFCNIINDFRLIRLKNNELTVLLISSASTATTENVQKAAALLQCAVGAYQDTIPGLAHFVEHMIFMGSEKYPAENEFEKHITVRICFPNLF